ncbi:MAG: T9SS type A sorting domain-containing protein [Bacteroidota bacterium]
MKNSIKFLYRNIALILIVFAFNSSYGQIDSVLVNYNLSGLHAGDTVLVPVIFKSNVNVANWEIVFFYNRDVLKYDFCTFDAIWGTSGNQPGVFNNGAYTVSSLAPEKPNQIATKVSWSTVSGTTAYACNPRTAFTLRFIFNGGSDTMQVINKSTLTTQTQSWFSYLKTASNVVMTNTVWKISGIASGNKVPITSLSGGASWKTASSWDKGHIPNTSNSEIIIASNTTTPMVLDTNYTTNLNVTINSGAAFSISSGKTFTVNANFLLKSDKNSTGSFIQNGTFSATSAKVEKYIKGNEWHIMSIPISSETANVFNAANTNNNGDSIYVKYLFNNSWNWIYSVSTALSPYQGYFVWADTIQFHHPSPTLNFTGTINSANQTVSTIGGTNWQMIGNSYTSAIDWSTVASRSNAAGSAYYCWSPAASLGAGAYATSDGTINANGATKYIPAMQGFFIKSLNTNGISFTSANKVHNTQPFFKSSNDLNNIIRLTASIGSRYDETVIAFDQIATNNYDIANDVTKLMSNDSIVPEIYTIASAEDLVINRFGAYPYAVPFNVNLLKTVGNNNITITASDFSNFDTGVSIILEDLLLSTTQDLRINPVYTFTASLGNNSGRFVLHFANPTYGVNEINKSNVSIYSYEKDVYINTNDNVKEISIYNIMGQEILKKSELNKQALYKLTVNNAAGNYIVKVLTDKGVYTEKVFIK